MNSPFARKAPTKIDPSAATVELNNSLPQLGIRMFGATLYATGFCFVTMIFMSFLINEGTWGAIVYQLFNLIIYTPVIYMTAWKYGSRDRNYVHFKRMDEDSLRGFKIGLFGLLPYILCLLLLILAKAELFPDLSWLVRILYSPFVVIFNLLVPNVLANGDPATIANATYGGIFLASLLHLYTPLVAGLAYRLGYKDVSLYQKLIYQNIKPNAKKNPKPHK